MTIPVMKTILGIVPGNEGCICGVFSSGVPHFNYDMPLLPNRNEIDRYRLQAIFRTLYHDHGQNVLCVIEGSKEVPSDTNPQLAFQAGFDLGLVLAMAEAFGFETQLVAPDQWRDALGIHPECDHGASLRTAKAFILAAYAKKQALGERARDEVK